MVQADPCTFSMTVLLSKNSCKQKNALSLTQYLFWLFLMEIIRSEQPALFPFNIHGTFTFSTKSDIYIDLMIDHW